jgi:predicted nucleotidyltransferase
MAAYREGIRRRLNRPLSATEQAALEAAWRGAREIAERLVKQYGAKRVILFGSVVRKRRLRRESDIDLATEGMPLDNFYKIVGDLRASDVRLIDLVRYEGLRESFKKVIASEGVVLAHDGE